ncbi:MAG: hypothetical protein IAG13_36455, partial [Deltaproteobacteria bacterium]|nr:hypothetical protein [Nannocystaceae bacterium]
MTTQRLALGLALLAGCSTVAPLPSSNECDVDSDCNTAEGEVCANDTRVCVDGSRLPPLPDLAFDIQAPDGFRVELAGCDCDITQKTGNNELLVTRLAVQQRFDLNVYRDGSEDVEQVPSLLYLSADSRFSVTTPAAGLPYPMNDGALENPQPVPTVVQWPRYHPYDALPPALRDGGQVVWRTVPLDAAPVWRLVRPPQTIPPKPEPGEQPQSNCNGDNEVCRDPDPNRPPDANFCMPDVDECTAIGDPSFAFSHVYDDACDRQLSGRVVLVDPVTLARRDS